MKPIGLVAGIAAVLATTIVMSGEKAGTFDSKLPADRQALHVLNRMAYGPRPGDVAAVQRMGVQKWIRQQLDPAQLPENPLLEDRLKLLATLQLPTWQLIEGFQQPQMMSFVGSVVNPLQLLPQDKMMKLQTNTGSTAEERRAVLESLTPEVRGQVLNTMSPLVLDGMPQYRAEAEKARQLQQENTNRLVAEQQRRMRPPLTEVFTPDQLEVIKHGSDAEKSALLDAMGVENRTQAFRAMGPQGSSMLPAAYRRQGMLVANPQQGVVNEVIEAKLQRAVLSNRQLEEVLVDFWFNHFNVSVTKNQLRMFLPSYERDAIRPHVLGHFRDLLLATARHPAMLVYLDNFQSQAPRQDLLGQLPGLRLPGINENYGRELLELHTLGVDGGYTQDDVVNVARVFTGWTVFDIARIGEFQFNPQNHDRNEKKVLGKVFPRGGGESEGVQVIDMLARHPSTAHFISLRLAQRFVADEPPPALVERMAATFLKTDGDLRAVMETLLLSKEFLSEGAWRAKVKSPLEMVASSLRALDADVTDTGAVAQRIADLGQPLYAKVEPTGYPNTSAAWANSVGLLGRMNFASALLAGQIDGVKVKPEALQTTDMRRAMLALTGVEASPEVVAAVEKGAGGNPPAPTLVATALIGSPDFQKR